MKPKRKAAAITNPIATFTVSLPLRRTLRVMVWASQREMHANVGQKSDYAAIFIEDSGRCIGTIHLFADDIVNGTRAHEIRHAVDTYGLRVYDEKLCRVTEAITEPDRRNAPETGGSMIVQVQVVRCGRVVFAVGHDAPVQREYDRLVMIARLEVVDGDVIRTVTEDSKLYDRLGGRVDQR
jgi:hypothetical protein